MTIELNDHCFNLRFMMKRLLIASIFSFSLILTIPVTVFGQDDPPAAAMPNKGNVKLINDLVEVTDFKNVFKTYCIWRISNTSKESNWSGEKIQEITESINFKYFEWTVQNALASYSKKELQDSIELYKKEPAKYKMKNIIVDNNLIQRNLESFSAELLKGNYVMPKKK